MKNRNFNSVLVLLSFSFLISILSGCSDDIPGKTESTYILKLAHDQTSGHPYDLGVKQFASAVEAATDGAVTIKIYPSAQLGDTAEQIEGLRMGVLDLSLAAFSHVSQFVSEFGLFGAPYLFEDEEHFANVFDGPVGKSLDAACREKYNIRLLCTFTSGYRLLFNRKRPVLSIDDLAGLKIRVMSGEADALTWKAYGAIPAPMPYSECYSALQAGVIDGAENEPVSILANKFYEPCPYFAVTDHLVLPMGLFMSEQTLKKLPSEYQQVIIEEAQKAAIWERDYITDQNQKAIEQMVADYGVEVTYPDKDELREKSIAVQELVSDKMDLSELLEQVKAAK